MPDNVETPIAHKAYRFVVLFGLISLLSDFTYEGARGITGPFLSFLGATGTVVGIIAGLGELLGYGLRLLTGHIADRSKRYWAFTIVGYTVNLLAVPALALASTWQSASALILLERTGKAVRTPARDVLLTHAAARIGHGTAFGLHEAMDQIGAVLGPLAVALVLSLNFGYPSAFAFLGIGAIFALFLLLIARLHYPRPQSLEPPASIASKDRTSLSRAFWLYIVAASLVAAGFSDFALVAFRIQRDALLPPAWTAGLYAFAMLVDAGSALLFGRLFDKAGLKALALAVLLSSLFSPLLFLCTGAPSIIIGLTLWGIGMGAQESIMRAGVAQIAPPSLRGTAFGLFHFCYGLFWFLGSALMGVLLDLSPIALVFFSIATQLAAIPILLRLKT